MSLWQKNEKVEAEVPKELDYQRYQDIDEPIAWMNAEPGEYSGDQYDEEAVKAEIAQWPEGLEAEEYFYRMLALTAEDYRKYQEFLEQTVVEYADISSKPNGDLPDGEPQAPSLHVQLLMDVSASMAGEVDGGGKLELAKKEVADFAANVPENAHVSLRIYGQDGVSKTVDEENSCGMTAEIYPMGAYQEENFQKALNSFVAAGYTPLALAIKEAAEDLKKVDSENTKNVIYVVSDGKETCGGDPVAEVEKLQDAGIDAIVNIIGFDIEESEREALEAIAKAGNGEYFSVNTAQELRNMFREERNALISQWYAWQNKNVQAAYDQQNEYVSASYELQNEAISLSNKEQNRQIELTYYLDEILEDPPAIGVRSLIRGRSLDMRSHIRSEYLDIRQEARSEGLDIRQDVRKEALEERQELREQ